MAGKKGAKKTVGRVRRDEEARYIMKLYYVKKPNGAYAARYKRVFLDEGEAQG